MCLKRKVEYTKDSLYSKIMKKAKEFIDILQEIKLKEQLYNYELVEMTGKFNMLDEDVRLLVGLNQQDYIYIMDHYEELKKKYPDVQARAEKWIRYMKSANISKVIAVKGCQNCIGIVGMKLDVSRNDLCESCKRILDESGIA